MNLELTLQEANLIKDFFKVDLEHRELLSNTTLKLMLNIIQKIDNAKQN